ncbi:MAG TPA: cation diffusion facilitator family transporter [bacterium]|nr:cation diffusion facilitator family transporter [bacterium]
MTENNSTPDDKQAAGLTRKVTVVGLIINILLSAIKFAAGTVGSSNALIADAVHSLSDTATDLAILVGVRFWSLPPDREHPYGHRRIETLITFFIGLSLAAVAVGLIINSLSAEHSNRHNQPELIALLGALLSIVVKELLYRWTFIKGKSIKSTAVMANAWHHRSDGLSSIPAAIAITGAMINPSWAFLDHIGAIIVSVMIIQAAWRIGWPAIQQLIDAGASPETIKKIENIAISSEGVKSVHKIRSRNIGSGLQIDLHVKVDPQLTVSEGHDIASAVKYSLLESDMDILDVITHIEPCSRQLD